MNSADLSVQQSNQPQPAGPREVNAEPTAPEQVHHWHQLDPSLASAVLAKTEEELLGGLAALMRNKVETEKATRRLAQIVMEAGQAQKELERVQAQVRQAEDELAMRTDEQQRVKEQVLESQALLRVRQEQVAEYREIWNSMQAETERARRELIQFQLAIRAPQPDPAPVEAAAEDAAEARAEMDAVLGEKEGLQAELRRLEEQRNQLSEEVADLRREVQEHRAALEAAQHELHQLSERRNQLQAAPGEAQSHAAEPAISAADRPGDPDAQDVSRIPGLEETHSTLLQLQEKQFQLTRTELAWDEVKPDPLLQGAPELEALKDRTVFESYAAQLRDAHAVATRADEKSIGLPLWFGEALPPVAKGFDSYRLESEFFSDEPLDARVITELVSKLPGLDGCLVLKNRGPVLASRLAEHYYEQLRVPNRDYSLLFGRLPNRRDDLQLPDGRVAIYQLENGFLTVTQADHIFVITTSGQPRLKPGMPHKLATIARELAKMYPEQP